MENKESVIKAYQKLLQVAKKHNMNELEEYNFLIEKFEKASNSDFEEDSNEAYFFQAIVKRLNEITMIIKAT